MIRSLLYVPASSERFVAKAAERGADAIILDLEDAVAPSEKVAARNKLAETVPAVGRNGATVFVRINSEPERLRADAEAAVQGRRVRPVRAEVAGPEGAGSSSADGSSRWRRAASPTALVPMIEDPGAVLDARSIAEATPRVFALLTGGEDLATALNAEPTPEVLHRSQAAGALRRQGRRRAVVGAAAHRRRLQRRGADATTGARRARFPRCWP